MSRSRARMSSSGRHQCSGKGTCDVIWELRGVEFISTSHGQPADGKVR